MTGVLAAASHVDLRHITLDLTSAIVAPGASDLQSLHLEDATLLGAVDWTVAGSFVWVDSTLDAGSGLGSPLISVGSAGGIFRTPQGVAELDPGLRHLGATFDRCSLGLGSGLEFPLME